MASFTGVGDVLELFIAAGSSEIQIDISGTYDMTILFQREQGSRGSGVWETLRTFNTANQTEQTTYMSKGNNDNVRLFVETDTSGTATVLLTDITAAAVAAAAAATAPAFRGALVALASNITAVDYTAGVAIPFDAETYDTDTIHDNVTLNTRLTVPDNVTKVRISFAASLANHTLDTFVRAFLLKNGSPAIPGDLRLATQIGAVFSWLSSTSAVLEVTSGDYFEVKLQTESDISITLEIDGTWFAMEIIE